MRLLRNMYPTMLQRVFFGINFDGNKIEICGFDRSKEEMKLHRVINTCDLRMADVIKSSSCKLWIPD